ATSRTFNVDAIKLAPTANSPVYKESTLSFDGIVNSPVLLQNNTDSTRAFQIQNAAGTSNLLLADTLNSAININGSLSVTPGTAAGTITLGSTAQTGLITLGQSTDTNEIDIGNANTATGKTQTIKIGAGTPAGTGQTAVTIGNNVSGSGVTVVAGTGNINLNAANIATNQSTVTFLNSTATNVTEYGAGTSISIGATTGTITLKNANQTFGNSAGSGLFTNNGATLNTTLAVGNDSDGGVLGGGLTAAQSVDIYSSISAAQTTAGQSITIPTPTASTTYGR